MQFTGEVHPAAELFPLMSPEELAALTADITANGLRQPLVLDGEGRLLDGRNRLTACERAGVPPAFVSVDGVDPVAYVVSLNVRRRNLTASQRAIAAAEAWELTTGQSTPSGHGRREALAALFGVGEKYVQQARALVERDPDAAARVKAGAALAEAYEALQAREREARSIDAARAKLEREHADLAELVEAGKLALADALAAAAERDAAERQRRRAATQNLADAVRLLDHGPHAAEQARHVMASAYELPPAEAVARAFAFLAEVHASTKEEP